MGDALWERSPIDAFTPMAGPEITLDAGASLTLDPAPGFAHGFLVDAGSPTIAGAQWQRTGWRILAPANRRFSWWPGRFPCGCFDGATHVTLPTGQMDAPLPAPALPTAPLQPRSNLTADPRHGAGRTRAHFGPAPHDTTCPTRELSIVAPAFKI